MKHEDDIVIYSCICAIVSTTSDCSLPRNSASTSFLLLRRVTVGSLPPARSATLSLVGRRSALAGPHPTALHEGPRLLPMRRELGPAFRLRSRPFAREGKRPSGDRNVGFCLVRGWALHTIGVDGPKDIVGGRPCLHVRVHKSGDVDRRGIYRRPAFPPEAVPR
jgi:hypothetical protein